MARPRKEPGELRQKHTISLTSEEAAELAAAAGSLGMPRARFIREAALAVARRANGDVPNVKLGDAKGDPRGAE